MTVRFLAVAAALALAPAQALAQGPAQALAQGPALSLEQRMLLRCSAAFAVVAADQQRGEVTARAYPPLDERGREYFVRSSARLMDELHLTREQIALQLRTEFAGLQREARGAADPPAFMAGVMRPCLAALDASGL